MKSRKMLKLVQLVVEKQIEVFCLCLCLKPGGTDAV